MNESTTFTKTCINLGGSGEGTSHANTHPDEFPTFFVTLIRCVQVFNRSVNSSFIVMEEAMNRRKSGDTMGHFNKKEVE